MPTLTEAAKQFWFRPEALLNLLQQYPYVIQHGFDAKIQGIPKQDWYDHPEHIRITQAEIDLVLFGADCEVCKQHFLKYELCKIELDGWQYAVCLDCLDELETCEYCDKPILPDEPHTWCEEDL